MLFCRSTIETPLQSALHLIRWLPLTLPLTLTLTLTPQPTSNQVDGEASDAESSGEDSADDEAPRKSGKWTMARKLMVEAWPVAWLMRVGSTHRLPFWTFLQTLTCWFGTSGKATTHMQDQRGLRQFSHHDKVSAYLEIRAERVRDRLALGPPETVPGFSHVFSYLDNFLKYLNQVEERRQRTHESEKHATVTGYVVSCSEAAKVPRWPPCVPEWNCLPEGTIYSWEKPRFICIDVDNRWRGVTVPELRVGAQLCNRLGRCLDADGLQLKWFESLGEELTVYELAEHCPQMASQFGRTAYSMIDEVDYAPMVEGSAALQQLSRVQDKHDAVKNSKCPFSIPLYRFQWPEVKVDQHGQFSEPFFSTTCFGFAERSRVMNPTVWAESDQMRVVDRRFGPFLVDVKEVSSDGNMMAHELLQEILRPREPAAEGKA